MSDVTLDLRDAAVALGVHYQTAYRWVRTGRLPARRIGGRYVIDRDDLDRLSVERQVPVRPATPTPLRLERSAARMHDALVSGDEDAARVLARRLTDEGCSVTDMIQEVLVPPLRRIGQDWHDGKLTIWVEHRASAICERILGDLVPNPRGRRRGTAMVAAVAGDFHSLPTTMATVALRDDNWNVHHLGANMPPEELVQFCAQYPIDVAVISVTDPGSADRARATGERIAGIGTPVIVGGGGRTLDELVRDARHVKTARQGK